MLNMIVVPIKVREKNEMMRRISLIVAIHQRHKIIIMLLDQRYYPNR